MRPSSIQMFEKAFFAALAISLVNNVLNWSVVTAPVRNPALRSAGIAENTVAIGLGIGLLLPLVLWYFIARRASNIAKWIYVVLVAFGLLGFFTALVNPVAPKGLILLLSAVGLVLQIYAAWQLFQPDAKAWLESGGGDPGGPIT